MIIGMVMSTGILGMYGRMWVGMGIGVMGMCNRLIIVSSYLRISRGDASKEMLPSPA